MGKEVGNLWFSHLGTQVTGARIMKVDFGEHLRRSSNAPRALRYAGDALDELKARKPIPQAEAQHSARAAYELALVGLRRFQRAYRAAGRQGVSEEEAFAQPGLGTSQGWVPGIL